MKKIFTIKGMHCDSCAKIIEMELKDKVQKIEVNVSKGTASVEFDNNKISEKEIKEIINGLGYTA